MLYGQLDGTYFKAKAFSTNKGDFIMIKRCTRSKNHGHVWNKIHYSRSKNQNTF